MIADICGHFVLETLSEKEHSHLATFIPLIYPFTIRYRFQGTKLAFLSLTKDFLAT